MTLKHMSLEEFLHLAQTMPRLMIYREMMADCLTPIGVVAQLEAEMQEGTLLESGMQQSEDGRYSYIAFGQMGQLAAYGTQITQRVGTQITQTVADPFAVLRQMVAEFVCVNPTHELLRRHGAVGFVTYDAVRINENIPDRHRSEQELPDLLFNFYHTTLIFDHAQHKLLLAKMVDLDTDDLTQVYQDTQIYLQNVIQKITRSTSLEESAVADKVSVLMPEVDVSDAQFMQLIAQAKHHISIGDAFQIVLSRCFKQAYTAKHLDIYRALRKLSPAPYMFYFPLESGVMVGASPEKLITVRQGQVEINPIAGTRARLSVADEEKNAKELLADEKELAEHMMLVDLARNDLGVVCQPGSVEVKTLLQVKHFSHVTHLTSVVTGRLQAEKDALDALQATFPAGTVSGAPKIRAMALIDTLETSRRGLYGGAFCRLDAEGNFDSCIAIRMAILRDGIATVRTGAGIVADSDPESEAAETRHKARGVLSALALAEGGLSC
ncbi:MAG: anthranilate synthase component I family protein [Legionellales bacterium]|nr:anthranilate synthase component I family protein [Legionellales bacterium]